MRGCLREYAESKTDDSRGGRNAFFHFTIGLPGLVWDPIHFVQMLRIRTDFSRREDIGGELNHRVLVPDFPKTRTFARIPTTL